MREQDGVWKCTKGYPKPFAARLLLWDGHANCDLAMNAHSVKYLFKYVFKGSDRALLKIDSSNNALHDEINEYINSQYLSTSEDEIHEL